MKNLALKKLKLFERIKTFSISLKFSIVQIQFFIVFFVIGIYGYPSFVFDYQSNFGLALRIFQLFSYVLVFVLWTHTALYFTGIKRPQERSIRFQIKSSDFLIGLSLFLFLINVRHKELRSSITGDEIALFDQTLLWSKFLASIFESHWENIRVLPARLTLAFIQMWILAAFFLVVYLLYKSNRMKRTILISTFIVFSYYKFAIGESYYYPNLEVLPYFLTSPLYLIFGISPKYTALAILSLFLVVIYNLTKQIIPSSFLRLVLVFFISISNILIDITSTLNHSVYFVYIGSIVLLNIKNKVLTFNLLFLLIILSVLRPTLLIFLILVLLYQHHEAYNRIEVIKKLKEYKTYLIFSLFIVILTLISRLVSMLFELRSTQSNKSISSDVQEWFKSLINLEIHSIILLLAGLILSLITKKYLLFYYTALAVPAFWFFIPSNNYSAPAYRVEVWAPAVVLSSVMIIEFISLYKDRILGKKHHLKLKNASLVLSLLFLALSINSYDGRKFRNYAWNIENAKYLVKDVRQVDQPQSHEYQIFGKVFYTKELIRLASDQDCKFLDVVYKGSFLLNSDISMNSFNKYTSDFSANGKDLSKNNSINCVILGNYPQIKFEEINIGFDLGFNIRYVFTDPVLGSSVMVYYR
jgi:hypothetical protein